MKKSFFLILAVLPFFSFAQQTDHQQSIDTRLGYCYYDQKSGSSLEVQYAYSLSKHFDLLTSLSACNGVGDLDNETSVFRPTFYSNILSFGGRGVVDFWNVCSFKLSARVGMGIEGRCINSYSTSVIYYPMAMSNAEFTYSISNTFSIGAFYGLSAVFYPFSHPRSMQTAGLGLSFNL